MKTVAYLRVSTRSQDLANQKLAILEFSQKRRFPIDQFIESRISSRKSPLERRIDEMLGTLQPGDRLLVSELSRLGRSLSQVIQIVETLVRRKIRFIAIKEAIEFDGKEQDIRALLGKDVPKAPLGRPSRFPLALAAASPSLVRSEIRSRSTSANNPNSAIIPFRERRIGSGAVRGGLLPCSAGGGFDDDNPGSQSTLG